MNENIQKMIANATCEGLLATSPMEELTLLDSAEVKADICPQCHATTHLEHDAGFKVCPNTHCHACYKCWNNKAYKIITMPNIENMSVNELMVYQMNLSDIYK